MQVSVRVRCSGPLAGHVKGFAAALAAQGYTDLSAANQLRLMADLSRWLDRSRLAVQGLAPDVVHRFVARRRRKYVGFPSARALVPLLRYLREGGVLPPEASAETTDTEIEQRFERYLVQERGLTPAVRTHYRAILRQLLADRASTEIDAAAVAAFVRRLGRLRGLAGNLSALRAVLRFFVVTGETATDLRPLVPSAPRWQQATLPKSLSPAVVRAVLARCDRRTTVGRRDHAAILLMVRLGLRAGEVAGLTLDAVDWKAGELVVRGKGGRLDRLPLPADVGEALVAYLRRRPASSTRALFLSVHAPIRAMTPQMVIHLAGHALRRAGVPAGGAHRLRHTAATEMLRRGSSLTEIAQVLRHRSVNTTAIYAKVDRRRLRDVACPWPSHATVDRQELVDLVQTWPDGAP